MKTKRPALAINLFKQVLEKEPNSSAGWCNLGYVYRNEDRIKEAREAFDKAIAINPDEADFYANLGATFIAKGTPDEAIHYLNKSIELQSDHNVARWNRALAYLEKGDYRNGWDDYDQGERISDRQTRIYANDVPKWNGEPNKTVVVYGEQGIGDEIMFASILPDLIKQSKLVIFDAHPRLAEIFRRSFPAIPIYGTRKDGQIFWDSFHKIDAKIAIGSLPKYFRNNAEDFTRNIYLQPDPHLIDKYKHQLAQMSDKPKIGISWRGGIKSTGVSARYIPLELWRPIFDAVDADFISLQYNPDAIDTVKEFEEKYPDYKIHHWPVMLADYDETAALVSNLDLIISVPQSVVHLAGAIGTPTLQLCPKKALWQMGPYGQDMPWYDFVKNYWQGNDENWVPVIEKVTNELCKLVKITEN